MTVRQAFILVAAASVLSCRPVPKLEMRTGSPLSTRELVGKSPVVVVGSAVAVTQFGPEVKSADEHGYPLRLQRITAQVENVLKGTSRSRDIVFYRYGWSSDHAMLGPWGIVVPGQRNVFFLDIENGTLRSIIDLYPAQIQVLSGRHPEPISEKTIEESVAEILLTPGEAFDPEAFSQGLYLDSVRATDLIGRAGTLRLLKPLLASKQNAVRQQACLVLAEGFYGQGQCLSELAGTQVPVRAIGAAEKAFQENLLKEASFRRLFLEDPMDWVSHEAGSRQPEAVLDVLQLLALHSDPQVRQKACDLMARNFPTKYKSGCGQQ
jgi:hypothetical protein